MILAALFFNPVSIPSWLCLWLIVPLCVAVAVVYKTVRVRHLSQLPLQILLLLVYMFVGLTALGAGLWGMWEWLH
ncbi:MAG: hypothetical protein NTV86_18560 [Planctomycetota bacterium]|nr:hypothetical protein [Planctomycetota bacterium]